MVLPGDYVEMARAAMAAAQRPSSSEYAGPDDDECDGDCGCGDDLG